MATIHMGEAEATGNFDRVLDRLKAGIVMRSRLGERGPDLLGKLVDELGLEIVSFDEAQSQRAITAFGRFGKGMHRSAQLNFGDCAVYALAEVLSDGILAIGNDFPATDAKVVPLS